MGCDYFADEDGEFHMKINGARGQTLAEVHLTDLEPGEKIYRDLLVGRDR